MLLSANADIIQAERLAKMGYDAIDVGLCRVIYNNDPYPHNPMLDGDDYETILDEHIAKCKELGLKIITSHIPYRFNYADPTIEKYDYYYNMTCRALRASEYLGAEWTVVHMRKPDETVEYVRRLVADSGVTRIGIAIENIINYTIDELIEAHDRLAAEGYRVGICFDTGHCHINKYHENDVVDTIRRLGSRIKMLHVHDNIRTADNHNVPYTGSIKWPQVMEALAEVGYEGAFNYELRPEKVPEGEARDAFDRYCVALGHTLIGMYEAKRKELEA